MTIMKAVNRVVRLRRRMRGPLRPTWTHEFETFAVFLHHYAKRSIYLPLSMQRRATEALTPSSEFVAAAEFEPVSAGGVPAVWLARPDSDPSRVLLYLHGGGYSVGSVDSHRDLLARMCAATGAVVLAPNYRLAPEHPYPAQLDDALAVYRWLLERGTDPSRLVVGGESAGGGLTLSLLMALRDAGDVLPSGGVCLSPWVDLEATSGSMSTNARYDYVSRKVLRTYARRFVPDGNHRLPLASPVHGDLSGLPPLLIHAGGAEVLLDESVLLARRARDAGVDVELDIWQDMIHAWHVFAGFVPEGVEAIEHVGAFVRRRTG
jgi:acetyl esterase/lipase